MKRSEKIMNKVKENIQSLIKFKLSFCVNKKKLKKKRKVKSVRLFKYKVLMKKGRLKKKKKNRKEKEKMMSIKNRKSLKN